MTKPAALPAMILILVVVGAFYCFATNGDSAIKRAIPRNRLAGSFIGRYHFKDIGDFRLNHIEGYSYKDDE